MKISTRREISEQTYEHLDGSKYNKCYNGRERRVILQDRKPANSSDAHRTKCHHCFPIKWLRELGASSDIKVCTYGDGDGGGGVT